MRAGPRRRLGLSLARACGTARATPSPRVETPADLLTPATIADDARWLRAQVAPGAVLILLLTPDLWDLALAASGWRERLEQIAAALRARLSDRLAEINAAIAKVAAGLPNTVAWRGAAPAG